MTNNFINPTIARVLGGDGEKTTLATPISSNKKSRLWCADDMNIAATPSATISLSVNEETQTQLIGFSIPTWNFKNVEGSPLLDNINENDRHIFEESNEI